MKTGHTINPLLLSIMAQAVEIVKSEELTSDLSTLAAADVSVGLSLTASQRFLIEKSRILTLTPSVLMHPFFARTEKSAFLLPAVYQFTKSFTGQDCTANTVADYLCQKTAVRLKWDPTWTSPPSWLKKLLSDPARQCSVWLEVGAGDVKKLTEAWCHQAVQLGWSWWLTPPKTSGDLPGFFADSKPLWRFWFTHPKSDQWVWPWSNILLKGAVGFYNPNIVLPRPWVGDTRHKLAWNGLEEGAWESLGVLLGGDAALETMGKSVFEWISNKTIVLQNRDI